MKRNIFKRYLSLFSKKPKTHCPVCGTYDVSFQPLPDFYRENAKCHGYIHFGKGEMTALESYSCSKCGASDRERLYAWWLNTEIESSNLKKRVEIIHFAPEPALSKKLRNLNLFKYQTADLGMDGVDFHEDIMSMSFEDESFDVFICSHVLEHVESDDRAIQELHRITKRGGCGILMAPIIVGLPATIEDPSVTTDEGRWRMFGQNDHVRLYAHDDYVKKMQKHGFIVNELGLDHFGSDVFKLLGLKGTSILYIVEKP